MGWELGTYRALSVDFILYVRVKDKIANAQVTVSVLMGSGQSYEENDIYQNPGGTDFKKISRRGKRCCFEDAQVLEIRLRQIQICNHAVKVLSTELNKLAESIDFPALHSSVMQARGVDGKTPKEEPRFAYNEREPPGFAWSLLSEDESLKALEHPINRFKQFETFFQQKTGGRTNSEMKMLFEQYLIDFIRIRDALIKMIAEGCS